MTFQEFVSKQFPERSVFDRPQFDFVTNLVKWFALRFAYALYKLGFSANALDVIAIFISACGFMLFSTAYYGYKLFPVIGILLIYFHVFVDFADGPIAKASGTCTPIGHLLDDLGCHADRYALLVLIGFFTGSPYIVLASVFAAGVVDLLVIQAKDELPQNGIIGFLLKIYVNKYSFLSMRFMLFLIPLFFGIAILANWDIRNISLGISIFYIAAAVLWFLLCVPTYLPKGHAPGSVNARPTFEEFISRQFSEKSVFKRKDRGAFQNFVKWIALYCAYILFKLRVPANLFTVISHFISFVGFVFLSTAQLGYRYLPLIGVAITFFHVFADFVDGSIAKGGRTCSRTGAILDDFGLDVDRIAYFALLGIFTGNVLVLVTNVFVAYILVLFSYQSIDKMLDTGILKYLYRIYVHRFSFLSVRFMLGIFPAFLALAILLNWDIKAISLSMSVFYMAVAVVWIFLCIPTFKKTGELVEACKVS